MKSLEGGFGLHSSESTYSSHPCLNTSDSSAPSFNFQSFLGLNDRSSPKSVTTCKSDG
jgi:hypothetical protein